MDFDVIIMATGFETVRTGLKVVEICVKPGIERLPDLSQRKKQSNYIWILPGLGRSHCIPWHYNSWVPQLLYGLWHVSNEPFVSYIVLSQTLAGPNISTGHASVIFAHEVQVTIAVLSQCRLILMMFS